MTSWIIVDDASGVIVNRFDGDELEAPDGQSIHIDDDVAYGIGGTFIGGVYTAPVYPDPIMTVPDAISDRQFFQQLAVEGTITNAEALAAVRVGTIPAVLQAFVDAIPDPAKRFSADMVLSGATTFERLHPMSEAIRIAQGRTEDQRDEFFAAAATL